MTNILIFPVPAGYRPVRVRLKKQHVVWLRVTKRMRADVTRWQAQYAIQRGCGFRGLKGFTDQLARAGEWFKCRIRHDLLERFLRDLELAVSARAIELWVDDQRLKRAL